MFLTVAANAQRLNREFTPGIRIGTPKSVIIDSVMEKLRRYYENNTDGILKFVRKKYGVKNKKIDGFIIRMQEDVRTKLQSSDEWQTIDTYFDYGTYLSKVLGKDIRFPGLGVNQAQKNGDGYLDFVFKKGYLQGIYGNINVTKDYTIYSGFAYNNTSLANIAETVRKDIGTFTFKQTSTTWSSCSTNNENVPVISYYFNDDYEVAATFTYTYGIYQRKVVGGYRGQCVAAGNHLTSIAFTIVDK